MEMSPSFLRIKSNRRSRCLFHCTSSAWFHNLESISTRAVFPTPVSPSMMTGTPHWYLVGRGEGRGGGGGGIRGIVREGRGEEERRGGEERGGEEEGRGGRERRRGERKRGGEEERREEERREEERGNEQGGEVKKFSIEQLVP